MNKILEDLIFLGAAKEDVSVFGKTWTLETLSSEKQLQATAATGNYDTLSRLYALKIEFLGRAIKAVDGTPLTDEAEVLEFVKKLQPIVVNKLYDEYEKIQNKQNESLKDLGEIKNS
jgi:viroplasmin and RNaseH domain-containing protein